MGSIFPRRLASLGIQPSLRSFGLLFVLWPGSLLVQCAIAGSAVPFDGSPRPALINPTPPVIVSTIAGRSLFGHADGAGREVQFANPRSMTVDLAGNLYVADTLNHTIRKITPAGVVTTLAGKPGQTGSSDGVGSDARFNHPLGVAVDRFGTVFVSDGGNDTIRAISPAGEVRTIAGQVGVFGSADGAGADARFRDPRGLAVANDGTIFVADSSNATIRAISPAGDVRTFAGEAGQFGSQDGIGAAARFTQPTAVAVDGASFVYVADIGTATIRAISPTGEVRTLAGKAGETGSADGTGENARFSSPNGVAVDQVGRIYVADAFNNTVRLIVAPGTVSTLAGLAGVGGATDGPAQDARFDQPAAIAVAGNGTIYVADASSGTIRAIDPMRVVSTLAGEASRGSRDGPAHEARFDFPSGLAVDRQGNIYVADTGNNTIRHISPTGVVRTLAGRAGVRGHVDGKGDAARFDFPVGLALGPTGVVYVADRANSAIRKIAPDGTTTTIGNITVFFDPVAVAVDASGNAYVADLSEHTIKKISPSSAVSTFAGASFMRGSDDGTGSAARFEDPNSVAVDDAGFVYVADYNGTIRKISPVGEVTTLAGQAGQRAIVDGASRDARFLSPEGIAVDGLGNLFVVDGGATIRQITPAGRVTTLAGKPGLFGGSNGGGDEARFAAFPGAIAVDHTAHLFIADSANNAIRKAVSTTHLINLSVRSHVGAGDGTLILGFATTGSEAKRILVRGIGPTLAMFGVANFFADPALRLFNHTPTSIETNDDWGGSTALTELFASLSAFPLEADSRDSALDTTVPAGTYTAHLSAGGTSASANGVGLVEVYDVDASLSNRLVNASARSIAGTGSETLIAGIVVAGTTPKTFLIRGAGPALTRFGVTNALADPQLRVFRDDGNLIAENDEWSGTTELKQAITSVSAFAFDSDGSHDAALLVTLAPGIYTAHVTGANGTAGIALVEVYEVP